MAIKKQLNYYGFLTVLQIHIICNKYYTHVVAKELEFLTEHRELHTGVHTGLKYSLPTIKHCDTNNSISAFAHVQPSLFNSIIYNHHCSIRSYTTIIVQFTHIQPSLIIYNHHCSQFDHNIQPSLFNSIIYNHHCSIHSYTTIIDHIQPSLFNSIIYMYKHHCSANSLLFIVQHVHVHACIYTMYMLHVHVYDNALLPGSEWCCVSLQLQLTDTVLL